MQHFLSVSNKRTLLLLDEFGTGSDPDLGGALAEVFFEELYNRRSFGVITTHYSTIKLKADQLKNAINGCMLFNTETLEPLYKFSIGQPGSSFTFEVAQINGIPLTLIEEAKTRLDERKVKMDKLLSELQREKTYLERLNNEHIEAQTMAQAAKNDFLEKKARYDEKLKTQQATIERDNKYLNAGKKMISFIDRFTVKSRKKDVNKPLIDEVTKYISVEKSKIEEAKRIVLLKTKAPIQKNNTKRSLKPTADPHQRAKIVIGSTVKLIETKQTGTVDNIVGDAITVVFGFIRMKVERDKLIWLK
jgi:DNA mismatch repair protein MutS2